MTAQPTPAGAPEPRRRRKARLLPMPSPAPTAPTPAPAPRAALAHTLNATAALLSRSTRHVRRLIRAGRLKAKRDGRGVLILDADLRRFLDELPPAN